MAEAPAHTRDLAAVEDAAWAMLEAGASSRHAAFHQLQLATVGAGGPRVRTVVLRGADRAALTLRVHTDARSGKVAELAARPEVELAGYDHAAKVQVRVAGRAELHRGDALAAATWAAMGVQPRAGYRQRLAPGARLAAPDGAEGDLLDDAGGAANFVVLEIHVGSVDWLYLALAGHRRARLCYAPPAGAHWIAP